MTSALLEADFAVVRRSFDVAASFELHPGERLSLFGASGAGKTSCLEAIAGTVRLRQGQIVLDGRLVNSPRRHWWSAEESAVEARRRQVSLVRQPTTLFPHMSVYDNVTYRLAAEHREHALLGRLFSELGLEGLAHARPSSLSGGQRQRACLARALARPFRALLLDEPFSAIDVPSRQGLRRLCEERVEKTDAVAVLVTHDLPEAQAFGHRMGVIDEGRLLQLAPAEELVRRPSTRRVAELVGYATFHTDEAGRVRALHPDRFEEGAHEGRGLVVRGTVRACFAHGARYGCEIDPDGPGYEASVRLHLDRPVHPGETVEATATDPPLVARSETIEP